MKRNRRVFAIIMTAAVIATTDLSALPVHAEEVTEELVQDAETHSEETPVTTSDEATDFRPDEQAIIESMATQPNEQSPAQVNVTAVLPDQFGLSCYVMIQDAETGIMYRLTLYSNNGYYDRCYIPEGLYYITDMHVFDDNTGKYPFDVLSSNLSTGNPNEFQAMKSQIANIEITLTNYDEVEKEIQRKILGYDATDNESSSDFFGTESENSAPTVKSDFDVTHIGDGTGLVGVTGEQAAEYNLLVKITTDGVLGAAKFTYSMNNGSDTSNEITIPLSGMYDLPGTGLSLKFNVKSSDVPGFMTGDVYTAYMPNPSTSVKIIQGDKGKVKIVATPIDPEKHLFDVLQEHKAKIIVEVLRDGKYQPKNDDERAVIRLSYDGGSTYTDQMLMPDNPSFNLEKVGVNIKFIGESDFMSDAYYRAGDRYVVAPEVESNMKAYIILGILLCALLFLYMIYRTRMKALIPPESDYRIDRYEALTPAAKLK